jgi:creatinine amidohydrolase
MAEKLLYAELTPHEFRRRITAAPVAYLPLGTLEWHEEHLPLGADGIQAQGFFCRLAEEVGGIVLPMLFLGPDRVRKEEDRLLYGMDIGQDMPEGRQYENQQFAGSAYWVPEDTFKVLLEAILKQLQRAGFRIVVGHGHGPSTSFFSDHAAEWERMFRIKCFHCWEKTPDADNASGDPGIQTDHAAMNETSLVMALRPDLVQMERLPSDLDERLLGLWGKDPRTHASPELGQRAIDIQAKRMSKILREALADLE